MQPLLERVLSRFAEPAACICRPIPACSPCVRLAEFYSRASLVVFGDLALAEHIEHAVSVPFQ